MEYTEEQKKANKLFEQHRIIDPFDVSKPDGIMPALLNWDDIQRYVKAIGMISPFRKQNLKLASYALEFLGLCIYYDEKGEKKELVINKDNGLWVASNSIVFLTLEPLIQLPDYIAARFNLKIDLVYKGCLLGTGPLVDPGFIGRLAFPLHNLTTNDYYLEGGSEVAWIEFTKISPNKVFEGKGEYPDDIENVPYRKFNFNDPTDVWRYMSEAQPELKSGQGSIRSSIPGAIADARRMAEKSSESAEQAKKTVNRITGFGIVGVLALFFGASIFYMSVASSITDSTKTQSKMLKEARGQVHELRQEVNIIEEKLDSLATINRTSTRNDAISPSKKPESTIQSPHQE